MFTVLLSALSDEKSKPFIVKINTIVTSEENVEASLLFSKGDIIDGREEKDLK